MRGMLLQTCCAARTLPLAALKGAQPTRDCRVLAFAPPLLPEMRYGLRSPVSTLQAGTVSEQAYGRWFTCMQCVQSSALFHQTDTSQLHALSSNRTRHITGLSTAYA